MQFLPRHQLPEIDCVLGDNHSVLGQAAREDEVVRLAKTTEIARMRRIVHRRRIQAMRELWRKTFVDEQLQSIFAQGRPPGLPTSGCVRA